MLRNTEAIICFILFSHQFYDRSYGSIRCAFGGNLWQHWLGFPPGILKIPVVKFCWRLNTPQFLNKCTCTYFKLYSLASFYSWQPH